MQKGGIQLQDISQLEISYPDLSHPDLSLYVQWSLQNIHHNTFI